MFFKYTETLSVRFHCFSNGYFFSAKNMNKHVLNSLGPSKILLSKFDLNINNAGYHVQHNA